MKAQNNEFKAKVKEAIDLIYLTTSDGPMKGKISNDRLIKRVVSELVSRGVVSRTGPKSYPVYEWAVKDQPTSNFYESVADSLSKANKEHNARYRSRKAARAKEQQEYDDFVKEVEELPEMDPRMVRELENARAIREAKDEVLCEELFRRGWRIANGRLEKTIVMMLEDDGIRKVTV